MAGYPQIVSLMSQHEELAILRKFGNLSIQNLLFMQAELMHLEEKLTRIAAKEDDGSSSSLKYRDWWTLSRPNENGGNEHWEIVMDIRTKLEKYHNQLYKHMLLSNCPKPDSYDLRFFRDWLEGPTMGNFPLRGPDRHAWSERYEADLFAIKRRETGGPFSRFFINTVIPQFHRIFGHRIKKPLPPDPESQSPTPSPITCYSDTLLHTILSLFTLVLACLLPISSIIILYVVHSMVARLTILVFFTAGFALTLALVTGARKVEIFGATSAFAAVMIVFLSGNNGKIN